MQEACANNKNEIKKIVLAYSGGLDTSIIIPWLKENYPRMRGYSQYAPTSVREAKSKGLRKKR